METKPFYLTSEFWVTVATVVTALAGLFPVGGKAASVIAAVAAGAYTISRGLAKAGVPVVPSTVPPDEGDKGSP